MDIPSFLWRHMVILWETFFVFPFMALGNFCYDYKIIMIFISSGYYGFILPPDQIIPTAEEVWAFHITAIREIYSQLP